MSTKYKARTIGEAFFITITAVGWVDVLMRREQKELITRSLEYCQKTKGLEIYAYVVMSSHLHVLCKADGEIPLSDIIRDFKKFTSKAIIANIIENPESRREWMLPLFEHACSHLKRGQRYKVWRDGYHAEVLYSNTFIIQKINYIHNNPMEEKIVLHPEDYYFSSARNYAGLSNEFEVTVLELVM